MLYTTLFSNLSLHDALPISVSHNQTFPPNNQTKERSPTNDINNPRDLAPPADRYPIYRRHRDCVPRNRSRIRRAHGVRSEEHTSELQSRFDLVCRLLLEKKK